MRIWRSVAVKDSLSITHIDHNTFYKDSITIGCFEKENFREGRTAKVSNAILANSLCNSLLIYKYSSIDIKFSLSHTDYLPGSVNFFEDPQFIDARNNNFYLSEHSPCISKGDPSFPRDLNKTITEIGALSSLLRVYG